MLIAALIIIVVGALVIISGIWQLIIRAVVMKNSKIYNAKYLGMVTKPGMKENKKWYKVYVPELDKKYLSVHPVFNKKKEPGNNVDVFINSEVHEYCCIKGVNDTFKIAGTALVSGVMMIIIALILI